MIFGSRRRSPLQSLVVYFSLLGFSLFAIFPVYWIFLTSLKKGRDVFNTAEILFPVKLTIFNYLQVFKQNEIIKWIEVSTLLAAISTLLALAVGILAAYSLTHFRFRGRRILALAIFFSYVIPKGLLFIPLFLVLNQFGLVDTFLGLVLAHETFSVPFCTWLLYGYFKTLPRELVDSGRIDGCAPLGILSRILLPLAAPGVATAAIFSFTTSWNEFLYAATLITNDRMMTLPLGISGFLTADTYQWGPMMAASMIAILPMLVLFIFAQRYIVQGLTIGAVKG
jgi:multiple sugar transport system permease protein